MDPVLALLVLASLVALATVAGALWRARTGRVRAVAAVAVPGDRDAVTPGLLGTDRAWGREATIVQFSTEYCGPCRTAERLLSGLADTRPGVAFAEIDLGDRPGLADRFGILQTPTVLLLDADGRIRARIGGVPRLEKVNARIDEIAEERKSHDRIR